MNVVQIQIQPVENGFVAQAVNVDGESLSRRFIATDLADLRKKVKELADVLYEPTVVAKGEKTPAAKSAA